MSERLELEEDLMDDLGFDEAEGSAMDDLDGAEEYDYAAEADPGAEEDWESAGEDYYDDGFDEEGLDCYDDAASEDAFEEAMAYALGAEGTDEFFRRLISGIRRIAPRVVRAVRRAAPVIGRVARTAAPLAGMIPGPWGQAAGTALGLLGRLQAEGASEDDAMDTFAEYAAYDESAIPIVAGLAARSVLRGRGARMPVSARRTVVRGMTGAARTLAQRSPAAVRALPRIVRSVRRTAAARRTSVQAIPRVVSRTAANIIHRGRLVRRLSRPIITPIVRRLRRHFHVIGGGEPRSFALRGPVRITISGLT